MKTIKWHVWVGVMVMVVAVLVLFSEQRVTTPTEAPNAFSMEPVQRNAGAPAAQPTPFAVVERKEPQRPECSLPLYPTNGKVAASRRIVSDTHAEIVYETQWVQHLDDADHDTFVARAKQWTPECRMRAIKKTCSPHCIYDNEYMAIIEAAVNLEEGKALLGAVLAINESELKHARATLTDMKKFAAYTKTIVPHSVLSVGGRECLERMDRDKQRINELEERVNGRFAFTVTGTAFSHARMCANCDESSDRERSCKWMHEEIVKGESRLHEAEKEHAAMRKVMARREKR